MLYTILEDSGDEVCNGPDPSMLPLELRFLGPAASKLPLHLRFFSRHCLHFGGPPTATLRIPFVLLLRNIHQHGRTMGPIGQEIELLLASRDIKEVPCRPWSEILTDLYGHTTAWEKRKRRGR